MKNLKDLMVPFELSKVLVSLGMIEPCAAVWNEIKPGQVDFLPRKFSMNGMLTFTPAYTHQQVKEWLVDQGFEIVVFPKFTDGFPGKKYGYAYECLNMSVNTDDTLNGLTRGIFALYLTENIALQAAFIEALDIMKRHKEAIAIARLSKFSYGEEVGHAPDLYDMTRSKVDEITRSFKALHTGTDEFDEDGLVLRESEFDTISIPHSLNGDILEVTYPGRKHLGEPDRIVRYKLYGYSYVVTNDKMSGIYSEKGLYKI